MALGEDLRKARLARKETCSQVAAATRMKVQVVEDLEAERFDRIAAPIYVKGFIRLYAGHVGLDPKPFIDDYLSKIPGALPALRADVPLRATAGKAPAGSPATVSDEAVEQAELFEPPVPNPAHEPPPPQTGVPACRRAGVSSGFAARPSAWLSAVSGASRAWIGRLCTNCGAGIGGLAARARLGNMTSTPSRIAAAALGLLFVVVVVVSIVARLAGCSAVKQVHNPVPAARETLIIAAEPPGPYAD